MYAGQRFPGNYGFGTGVFSPSEVTAGQRPRPDAANAGNGSAKPKRKFHLVDSRGYRTGSVYQSTGPGSAARKAASAGHSTIHLYDRSKGRVYSYQGWMEPNQNPTAFSRAKGINNVPRVKSLGYYDVPRGGGQQ